MKAVTDFAATREQIAFAKETFAKGFALRCERLETLRQEWIEKQIKQAWFNKDRDYWTAYANGELDRKTSSCEALSDSYIVSNGFKLNVSNYIWFEARLEDATKLLQKFDCAVDTCEAVDVILSDKDLTLLSVSLQSALDA